MYRLPQIVLILFGLLPLFSQSPHEEELRIDCGQCHNPDGWDINYETIVFSHDITEYKLEGSHAQVDCKLCHTDLKFKGTPTDCMSCHADVHSMSVGNDCVRCHTPDTWLVDYIPELHEENGFPLTGAHSTSSCVDCHKSEPLLIFERIGNECINCHREDYFAAQHPNHIESGFSTNCVECHNPLGQGWSTDIINHDFFPLTLGHDLQDCKQCHTTDNYSDVSSDCVSCHQTDYTNTQNPNHESTGFSTDCASCHSTNPGWTPATIDHDFFPLTLGHDLQDCKQCHTTDNYSDVSSDCVSCHQTDYTNTQDPDHESSGISTDCASCHSTNPGWSPATIDHNFFPLTLGHDLQDCKQCHTTDNYSDVSSDCVSCHQTDYDQTNNPNHQSAGFSSDCASCHTTNPGWTPATIDHDFFPLTLGHDLQDCKQCHTTDNYSDVSSDCVSCHQTDYDQTNNPNHQAAQFPTDCAVCHTTNPGWTPASFDHDGQYFPIYNGKHKDTWNDCVECHANSSNYAVFTCLTCHSQSESNNDHSEVSGYMYESNACLDCHPNGEN